MIIMSTIALIAGMYLFAVAVSKMVAKEVRKGQGPRTL